MIKKVKSILSKTNKRSQNSLLIFFFSQWKTQLFSLQRRRIEDSSRVIRIFMDYWWLHFFLWNFSISNIQSFFYFKNWTLSPLIIIIMSWLFFVWLWLGHCNCACSYSLIGCGILIGLWLSHTPFGRKLPTFLLWLINLYLFLSALFATKWCVPSA